MSRSDGSISFTRARDLLAVAGIALVLGYLLVRISYTEIPQLPRLVGVVPALLGVAEAVFGWGLRSRIQAPRDAQGRPTKPPVPPLVAARAVMMAKASSLAGSAFAGLSLALLGYVAPKADEIAVAGADQTTAVIALIGAASMVAGALWLEHCCRTPSGTSPIRHLDG